MEADDFNGDVSTWDVSNVWWTGDMFRGANSFNQDISGWDVSTMGGMFGGAV